MVDHTIDLPGLLGARICHDLISPVGAIGNGMELLTLSGDLDGPERDLIAESTASASARLQLFRLAFGRGGSGQSHSAREIADLLGAYTKDSDLQIHWGGAETVSRSVAKALLLLVMCLETVVGRAGHVSVEPCTTGWQITSIAARGKQAEALLQRITNAEDWPIDLSPAQVQFPLAKYAIEQLGIRAQLHCQGAQITLTLNMLPEAAVSCEQFRHQLLST